ncbi:adenosine deaminase [Aciduliprofundum sp. MAR08-339]|uniref:adenosine deaminase n=1 Tax=Aciduliprofundum sp. (strain MAR08-339) TaxID=673860 RepID=UPI00373AF0AA
MEEIIATLPKAELHIHVEGALEPELMFRLSKENNVSIPYHSVEEIKKAYNFENLQDFLNIYYQSMKVLRDENDFYQLTWNYIKRAKENNVQHVELSFDPQAHMRRGVKFENMIEGIFKALRDGERKCGISWKIILSILRDMPVKDAINTLNQAEAYLDVIHIIGLDSAELGNPPSKFKRVFEKAEKFGLLKVAHAGEEGPAEYVREAIEILGVHRIDHGIRTVEDPSLLRSLGMRKMTFTLCPLSNLKLKVVRTLENYPLRNIMNAGIIATINSDDPAYFGGYVNENYLALSKALKLNERDIINLAKNSIMGSFASEKRKKELLGSIEKIRVSTLE